MPFKRYLKNISANSGEIYTGFMSENEFQQLFDNLFEDVLDL